MAATLEQGIFEYLTAGVGTPEVNVQAVIGTRFYPRGEVPQSPTYPFATQMRIGTFWVHSADGDSGLAEARMQIESWALDYPTARNLSDLLRLALNGYVGEMGDFSVGGVILQDEQDAPEDPRFGNEIGIQLVQQEYIFIYEYERPVFA
jgi:hypothetical protein